MMQQQQPPMQQPGMMQQPPMQQPSMMQPPMQQPGMQPPPGTMPPPSTGPGFGMAPSPPAQPGQPSRVNYADELTDFGVPPQSTLQTNVGSPTPTTIPGGHVITTAEVEQAVGSNIVFIDVWQSQTHPTLPGALELPGAGNPGSFNDPIQQQLWTILAQITNRQAQQPLMFFCTGSRCWESYNAALRAINMGFKMVLWYRGGLSAWQAAGQQMNYPNQGNTMNRGPGNNGGMPPGQGGNYQ
jgi:PQQ-dependent catabolism-associated CXXCW motif protein